MASGIMAGLIKYRAFIVFYRNTINVFVCILNYEKVNEEVHLLACMSRGCFLGSLLKKINGLLLLYNFHVSFLLSNL